MAGDLVLFWAGVNMAVTGVAFSFHKHSVVFSFRQCRYRGILRCAPRFRNFSRESRVMILAIGGLGPLAPVGLGGFKTHPGSLNEFDVIVIHPKTPTKTHVKTVMYSCVAEKHPRLIVANRGLLLLQGDERRHHGPMALRQETSSALGGWGQAPSFLHDMGKLSRSGTEWLGSKTASQIIQEFHSHGARDTRHDKYQTGKTGKKQVERVLRTI